MLFSSLVGDASAAVAEAGSAATVIVLRRAEIADSRATGHLSRREAPTAEPSRAGLLGGDPRVDNIRSCRMQRCRQRPSRLNEPAAGTWIQPSVAARAASSFGGPSVSPR